MSKIIFWTLYLFFNLTVSSVYSQELLVKMGHVFDPVTGSWAKDQLLEIKAGKIRAISKFQKDNEQKVVDLGDYYIVPGLIDAHTHLYLSDPTFEKDFSKGLLEFVSMTSLKDRIALGERRGLSLLMKGFTAVRDLGNSGRIDTQGMKHTGPRIYSSGPGYVPQWGQFPPETSEKIIFQEYERLKPGALKQLKNFKHGTLKLYADEEPNHSLTPPLVLKEWVNKAHANNLKVAIHGILPKAIQAAIDARADSLEHGTNLDEVQMKQMASQNMYWVPSTGNKILTRTELKKIRPHHVSEELSQLCSKIPKARNLGVKLAFGSDNYFSLEQFGIDFGESNLEALLFFSECSLSPVEIIRMATLYAAELIGDKALGDLKLGSYADFVVYKKDPLKDISVLKTPYKVFKAGQEVLK